MAADRKPPKLNARRQRFVEEYLLDLNATQAAIRAGYSERSARFTATELLATPEIQEAVRVAQAARSARTEITADRVVLELARVAFADLRDVASWESVYDGHAERTRFVLSFRDSEEISAEAAAAVAEVSHTSNGFRLKMHSKTKALELLARHFGLLEDRTTGIGAGGAAPVAPTPLTPENVHDIREAARARLAAASAGK